MGSSLGPNAEHESSLIRSTLLTARYATNTRLSLILSIPYREITSPKEVGGSTAKRIERSFRGLGDAIALARYQLNQPKASNAATFHALVGLRMPTGEANPNHTWTAADGSQILSRDPVLQPGFGTWDPIIGFQWTKPQPKGRSFFVGTIYRHTGGTNEYGYRYGSEFQFTAGAALPMGQKVTFVPQLMGQFSGYDHDWQPLPGKTAGRVGNTGGKWLYFLPNVRYGNVELNVQIPVYRKTNGNILNPSIVIRARTNFDLALTKAARAQRALRGGIVPLSGDFKVISRGESVDLAQHAASQKITVFEFASRKCGVCQSVTPKLNAILKQRPDVAVRLVDVTESSAPARAQHQIETTPAFFVVDRNGAKLSAKAMNFDEVCGWLDGQNGACEKELVDAIPVISRGEKVDMKEHLAQDKVTVFQFFTPTCVSCRAIAPGLRQIVEDAGVSVKRIDVSDNQSAVVEQYRIKTTPTFYVFSAGGQLVGQMASADYGRLAQLVEQAKKKGASR